MSFSSLQFIQRNQFGVIAYQSGKQVEFTISKVCTIIIEEIYVRLSFLVRLSFPDLLSGTVGILSTLRSYFLLSVPFLSLFISPIYPQSPLLSNQRTFYPFVVSTRYKIYARGYPKVWVGCLSFQFTQRNQFT